MNVVRIEIVAWLNSSKRSRVGVVMNISARDENINCFKWSDELDAVLYAHIPSNYLCIVHDRKECAPIYYV